jgi:hypothetical protein
VTSTIYETRNPSVLGTIRVLTEKRVEAESIEAGFNETKTFIILTDKRSKIQPILVKAKCRLCSCYDLEVRTLGQTPGLGGVTGEVCGRV